MIELNVRSAFYESRWDDITQKVHGCTAAFVSSDMLVAVLATASVTEAAIEYPEVQQAIKDARLALGRAVDAYLLLLVPTLSADDYSQIRKALDDPLICRKVAIELDSLEPATALRHHFPFLEDRPAEHSYVSHEAVAPEPGPEDLDLLDANGAENIVDQLLERERKVRTETAE